MHRAIPGASHTTCGWERGDRGARQSPSGRVKALHVELRKPDGDLPRQPRPGSHSIAMYPTAPLAGQASST